MTKYFSFIILCFSILLCGCSKKQIGLSQDEKKIWNDFVIQSQTQEVPYIFSGSLRFGKVDDTRRVIFTLWKNDQELNKNQDTIRLEIFAGIGANIAQAQFDGKDMFIFLPQENKAYIGKESRQNIRRILGIPFPLQMHNLYKLFQGKIFQAINEPFPDSVSPAKNGNTIFSYTQNNKNYEAELSKSAQLVRWEGYDIGKIQIFYNKENIPTKLEGTVYTVEGDIRFILLVKDRLKASQNKTTFEIPSNTVIFSLDQ